MLDAKKSNCNGKAWRSCRKKKKETLLEAFKRDNKL